MLAGTAFQVVDDFFAGVPTGFSCNKLFHVYVVCSSGDG
jgi:hypothetical protein